MDENHSVKISIGSGNFNDIIVNDKEAKTLHCNIFLDKEGLHVHRASREATVYINGEKMENRYADIKTDDELRIGDEIVHFSEYFNVLLKQMKEAEAEEEEKKAEIKEEKRLQNKAALIMLVHFIICFGLGFLLIKSIIDGSKLWIIISAILLSAYCLFNIISNILNKKSETEEDKKTRTYINRIRIICFIAMIPLILKVCSRQAELDAKIQQNKQRFEQYMASTDLNKYYRIVYNASDHDVTISYRPKEPKDTLLTFQIAQGTYDTIAYVSDEFVHNYHRPQEQRILEFTKDGVTITFDDNTSITHQFNNQLQPKKNNILSISSWEKGATNRTVAVYTITPETYTDAQYAGVPNTLEAVEVKTK